METTFDTKEKIGQKLFDALSAIKPEIKSNYQFSIKGTSYDVKLQSGATYYIGEIKVRKDRTIDLSLKYGPFAEFLKWAGMKKAAEKIQRKTGKEIKMLYVDFLSDGICVYELDDIKKAEFYWRLLPESNEDLTPIDKYVSELYNPIEIIRYDTNK